MNGKECMAIGRKPIPEPVLTWLGRLLGVVLAFVVFLLAVPLRMAFAESTPPSYTTSWYVDISDPSTLPTRLYNMGCSLGTRDYKAPGAQDDVVILLFGKPAYANNTYGAYTWTARGSNSTVFLSTTQIASGVEQSARGYYTCTLTDKTSRLYVAPGLNNVGRAVTYAHGVAWARMASNIQSWINARGYGSQVSIRAAGDMELNFNGPTQTRAWVDGYTAAWNYGPFLYDIGNAAGCPSSKYPSWDCGSVAYPSWTSEDVYHIAWEVPAAYPIPEIYRTDGLNAGQWYYLSLYSNTVHGTAMWFAGSLTDYQACLQMGGCSGTNNTPSQGWTQLWDAITSDSRTAQTYLRWSTDMKWR